MYRCLKCFVVVGVVVLTVLLSGIVYMLYTYDESKDLPSDSIIQADTLKTNTEPKQKNLLYSVRKSDNGEVKCM